MRKHDVRKWLHAILDLLPVIVIPVFMIYSHRHTIDSYSVTREEPHYVDFYQYVFNGLPNNTDNWGSYNSNNLDIVFDSQNIKSLSVSSDDIDIYTNVYSNIIYNNIYYLCFDLELSDNDLNSMITLYLVSEDNTFTIVEDLFYTDFLHYQNRFTFNLDESDFNELEILVVSNDEITLYLKNVQLFNLTQIFGSGNEPTLEVFESYLSQDYYKYGSNDVYIGMHDVIYDDTDIGSQMFYCLYNSVDKYFNMGNVFNLNGVYHWFISNIMGGSSPLALYIVWQIVLYEFVMDLLFLLYGLFMWFIDMCEHLMEKPFKSIK